MQAVSCSLNCFCPQFTAIDQLFFGFYVKRPYRSTLTIASIPGWSHGDAHRYIPAYVFMQRYGPIKTFTFLIHLSDSGLALTTQNFYCVLFKTLFGLKLVLYMRQKGISQLWKWVFFSFVQVWHEFWSPNDRTKFQRIKACLKRGTVSSATCCSVKYLGETQFLYERKTFVLCSARKQNVNFSHFK